MAGTWFLLDVLRFTYKKVFLTSPMQCIILRPSIFKIHDSYAAFRSQNLSMNVSFEVDAEKLTVQYYSLCKKLRKTRNSFLMLEPCVYCVRLFVHVFTDRSMDICSALFGFVCLPVVVLFRIVFTVWLFTCFHVFLLLFVCLSPTYLFVNYVNFCLFESLFTTVLI